MPLFSPLPTVTYLLGSLTFAAALLFAPAGAAFAQTTPASGATLFRNTRVFDGERMLPAQDILVANGLIVRLGQSITAPPGAVIVDGTGRTLLPGLIDSHTHSFDDALQQAVIFGVTTHLDMFTDHTFVRAMRAEQEAGRATHRADLFSSGTLVTAPRGHGTQFGLLIPTITSADSAQAFVDARIAEGSDWIKIAYDDGRAYGMGIPTIDRATLQAVISAAKRRNKLAVVHVGDAGSARTAIDVGANGLVHLFTDSMAGVGFAQRMAEREAFVIPTLVVLKSITGVGGGAPLVGDARLRPYLLPASRSSLAQGFPRRPGAPALDYAVAQNTVRELLAQGVAILAGSDAQNPGTAYGAALHRELELLVEAGLTPVQALSSATQIPARVFSLNDRGRVAPKMRADLLLVTGDPSRDITATRDIVGVWKSGVPIDRASFAQSVATLSAAAPRPAASLENGSISTFDAGTMTATLGMWFPSLDNMAGGTSTGRVQVVPGGANTTSHALSVTGTITNTVPYAWYGAMWTPGAPPMAPVDLSQFKGLRFNAQGDGQTYRVMVFAQSRGSAPLTRTFVAGPEWRTVEVTWADFGIDGRDVTGVVFAGGPQPGEFKFRVDGFTLITGDAAR